MKTSLIITVLVIIAVVGGGAYFFSQSFGNSQDKQSEQDSMMQKDGSAQKGQDAMMKDGSRYLAYEDGVLENTADKKRVLFFYANWCPTCIPADKNFQTNGDKIPEDVVLIRVNYNDTDTDANEKALAEKYGITYQHTFVQIDGKGNVVKKWNGGQIGELLANIQ